MQHGSLNVKLSNCKATTPALCQSIPPSAIPATLLPVTVSRLLQTLTGDASSTNVVLLPSSWNRRPIATDRAPRRLCHGHPTTTLTLT